MIKKNEHLDLLLKKKSVKLIWKGVRLFFLIGLSFMILFPVYKMVMSAFMSINDTFDNSVFLIPKNFSIYSFFVANNIIGYLGSLVNTLGLSFSITLIQLLVCTFVGYGFARFKFPMRNIIFALVIFTFVVPPQLYMSSLFIKFRFFDVFGLINLFTGNPLNLINSYTPMYLLALFGSGIKNGLFIYILRQGFRNLPKELEEAAYVDGAGVFKIFYKIMVPSVKAILITVGLFSFVWQYNDTFYSGFFLVSSNLLSIKYNAVYHWDVRYLNNYGLSDMEIYNPVFANSVKSAASLLIILPLIIVYLLVQKHFSESIERSGIVG